MYLRTNISLEIESSAIFRLQAIFVFRAAHVSQALDSMRGSRRQEWIVPLVNQV
jgi:hypothetical protein